jgi:hypothetical protein
VVEEGGGHLAAAGVVDTDEQDLGDVADDGSFGLAWMSNSAVVVV